MPHEDHTAHIEQIVQQERKPNFRHLLRLWTYVFSSAKLISSIYLGAFILLSLLRPLLAFIWGRYIQIAEGLTPQSKILPAILLLLGYFVINFFADMLNRYVLPREEIERLDIIQANYQRELLHSKMYKKLSSMSPEYLEIAKINDTIEQVFSFCSKTWDGMNHQIMMRSYIVIAKLVSVLSIAASLFIFNPWLCLIVLVAPLPAIWGLTVQEKLRFRFIKDNTKLQRRAEYFQNLMLSPAGKEIKALGLHDFFYQKWKTVADEYTLKEQKLIQTQTLLQILNSLLVSLTNVGGNVFAIIWMVTGKLTLGALGAVMSLIGTLVTDTSHLISATTNLLMKKNESAQFFDLMELPDQKKEGEDCSEFNQLEAKDLKYRYPLTEKYVLDGVNLCIRKGEKVAFVGENGMGKTTFVKLMTGMLIPSDGKLWVNHLPAEQVNPIDRYERLSVVMQDPARYNTFTIGDNIYLGDTIHERDEDAIDEALRFSGFNGRKKDEVLGKDTGGTDLSGGQWQKLAIARAAYRNRDLIVLDEPTSNLDPLAETEVFQKYIELSQDKTVVYVTHRISVAALADRIVVFSDGRIVQDGTHEELIQQEGEYARLYHQQAKWYNR